MKETYMSKNLTRKGLALGAAVALGSTLFAGTPASAAGEVVFEASAGTTYKTLLASTFVLNASLAPGQVASNISQLNYKVVNNTNGSVTAIADGTGTDQTLTTTVAEGNETTSTFTTGVGVNTLTVSTAGSATGTVEVIAFIDSDGDDTLDAGEYQTSRTITFVKPSEVTATTTFTKPTLGDASLTATVVLSGDINLSQVDDDEVTVSFSKTGTAITSYADDNTKSSTNPAPATYNSTAGALKAVLEVDAVDDSDYDAYSVTAGTFGAQAIVASANSGSNVLQTAATRTFDNSSVAVTRSGDAKHTTTAVYDVSASTDTDGAGVVRVGKGATVTATLKDASNVALASEAVTVVATGSGLAADTLTVNGTAVVDAAKEIAATTNASGQIVLTVDGTTADDTDTLTIAFKLQGVTTSDYVLTWDAADYYAFNLANTQDKALSVVSGASVAVDYIVVDQFGSPASSDYRLKFSNGSSSGRTTAASWIYTPGLSSGKATFTIADNGAGASSTGDTVTVALEKVATGGGYTSATLQANAYDEFVINYLAAAQTASAITASATDTTPALETVAVAAADKRYQNIAAPGYTDVTHVYGVATQADGSVLAGATLTVSAAGLLFQPATADGSGTATEDDTVFSLGSINVVTDSSGRYEVLVYSNLAGKKTVTVASGATSKTIDLTFDAADDNSGTALILTAVSTIKSGRTLVISGTVADKFGNPINTTTTNTSADAGADLEVTYEGPGLIVGSLPVDTDSTGKFTFRVLLGAGDAGLATVTAKYDANGDLDFADSGDLTATKSTLIGVSATVAAAKKAASVVVKNAEGLTVTVVSGTKSVTKIATSDSFKVSLTKLTAGKKTVKVYVNDILVSSKSVTVKK
jgi:hypothetical protein